MAQTKINIVEGWTGPLDFTLKDDGTATDLTGLTITGVAKNKSRTLVTLTGDVSVLSATGGQVRILPDTGDFLAEESPYSLRFQVQDGGGLNTFYPNAEAIHVVVREQ